MSLSIRNLERVFSFMHGNTELTLADPNPAMTPEAVMCFYANTWPELTTATVHGLSIKDDKAKYTFKTTIGTKG